MSDMDGKETDMLCHGNNHKDNLEKNLRDGAEAQI